MFKPGNLNEILGTLEGLLRKGDLTPGRHVDTETYICFTEQTPAGLSYHQGLFEAMPSEIKALFKNRERGERIGPFKIVAIFDFWTAFDIQPATVKYDS